MKNITLKVDERILESVRRFAADRGTSVNALVREHLSDIASRHDRARSARARLHELSQQRAESVGPINWTRDELHAR